MKRLSYLILIGVIVTALNNAYAQDGEGYFGLKLGSMIIDLDGFNNPFNIGLTGGYISSSGIGFETEYTFSMFNGGYKPYNDSYDVSIQTLGLYGTFRSTGNTYFKAKLGVVNESIDIENLYGYRDVSEDDSGGSFGIGVGFSGSGGGRVEFEYTIIEEDVNFFSFGFLF